MRKYHVWIKLKDHIENLGIYETVEEIRIYPKMFADGTVIEITYEEELK